MSETGRITDDQGRVVIVGTAWDRVTLRTVQNTSGAVELTGAKAEEFKQVFMAACWQAAAADGEFAGTGAT